MRNPAPNPSPSLNSPANDIGVDTPAAPRRRRLCLLIALLALALGLILYQEAESSRLQASMISKKAQELSYALVKGPSDRIEFPVHGPFDRRLGYSRLPKLIPRLQQNSFDVSQQVRFSEALLTFTKAGYYPPYAEKSQSGLDIFDNQQSQIYQHRYPRLHYASFKSIPPIIVSALLFIEDRDVLDTEQPLRNPAVDWGRFLKAIASKAGEAVHLDMATMGGSTLATQIEKYRHSSFGITSSISDKWRQMVSASVRAYRLGENTLTMRHQLVLDYLNSVPLSAAPGYGEVNGLGDGLQVWFNADFDTVNQLLTKDASSPSELAAQGLALRQVLALLIAHRRPSAYLGGNRTELAALVDSHLRILARAGIITESLRDVALHKQLLFRDFRAQPASVPSMQNKAVNVIRNRLTGMLGMSLYELDQLDLRVDTSLDYALQQQVTNHLRNLRDVEQARAAGLIGEHLLSTEQLPYLRYSFTLYERNADSNQVLVQTDNTDQPFDINEGSKLELGSTAKLRVLSSYLQVVAEVYAQYSDLDADGLSEALANADNTLSRWVMGQLLTRPGIMLDELMQATLDRRFSASPAEAFYTGGGMHRFNNYQRKDNNRNPSLREAMRESINLPFVRLLRELVNFHIASKWHDIDQVLHNDQDMRRQQVLNQFIDRESIVYLSRFWKKYQPLEVNNRLETLLLDVKPVPSRLALIYRYLRPQAEFEQFSQFLKDNGAAQGQTIEQLQRLYDDFGQDRYSLQDLAYLARVHPLELWLLAYLERSPNGTLTQAISQSQESRQQVYQWLLRTRAKNARDSRIRIMLEVEAFSEINRRWRAWGYPFDYLVPSLATALGSSGDRPAALAELMGIIINEGRRLPTVRINALRFGENTPYETQLLYRSTEVEEVMHPVVAGALREVLSEVVQQGTARRLQGAFVSDPGLPFVTGGKTGTGDNRLMLMGPGGQRTPTKALSRTATFVFYLGEKHFGTLTAFVVGAEASKFHFTSALPVQVLKSLAPVLRPTVVEKE